MPDRPTVSVIIVSYNTRDLTLRCLKCLFNDLGDLNSEVFVVDNASGDGSVDAIRAEFPGVTIIQNAENRGFGAANNLALARATGEFVLLLNSDAFLHAGAIGGMLEAMRGDSRIGVVGPRILNSDGSLQRSCYRFPSPGQAWRENLWLHRLHWLVPGWDDYESWAHDSEREVEWAIGACLLVRAEVVGRIGGFDERFFMYAEESDWQFRIRQGGWKVWFTPRARVTHIGGASGDDARTTGNRHAFNSLDLYGLKHHGVVGMMAVRAAMVVGCILRMICWGLVFVTRPARRTIAWAKMRMHGWLLIRQSTDWRVVRGAVQT